MRKKVLWLCERAHYDVHNYLIAQLLDIADISVHITPDTPTEQPLIHGASYPNYNIYADNDFIRGVNEKRFDVVVVGIHNGNPNVVQFQHAVSPAEGYIDIEHDLLCNWAEVSPKSRSKFVFGFTTPQEKWLDTLGYNIERARWYKLDVPCIYSSTVLASPLFDAVVIGSTTNLKMDANPLLQQNGGPFRKIWYKNYYGLFKAIPGTTNLPSAFDSTIGTARLPNISRFWLTQESSTAIDALLFGCIPIIWNGVYSNETAINDVVSSITLSKASQKFARIETTAVTSTNITQKVNTIRSTQYKYQHTLNMLQEPWIAPNYLTRPSVVTVLRKTFMCGV